MQSGEDQVVDGGLVEAAVRLDRAHRGRQYAQSLSGELLGGVVHPVSVERAIGAVGGHCAAAAGEHALECSLHDDDRWLPGHRWVAEIDGGVVGWAALSPVSDRDCYRGVAENAVFVAEGMRGRGVGKALLRTQVVAADEAGLWTLQNSVLAENRASIALLHSAGFRTVGVRERIARIGGVWRDTVFVERRSDSVAGVDGA